MIQTTEGQQMLKAYQNFETELPLSLNQRKSIARDNVLYHYIHIWESNEEYSDPCPISYYTDGPSTGQMNTSIMGEECFMCYNGTWTESDQSDTDLGYGYRMYDGMRFFVPDCNDDNIDYVLLPQNVNPPGAPSGTGFEFDLDPNNNSPESNTPDPDGANYASFEIFINETEEHIPEFVSAIPPSFNRSLKVNNDHDRYHINKLEKGFTLHPDDTAFFYSDAIVMEDPAAHTLSQKPFSKVVLRHGNNILYETCNIADANNPSFGVVPRPGISAAPIVYIDWNCHEVDLMPFIENGIISPGDYLTAEFIAADCGLGAHFGYSYIADICEAFKKSELILDDVCYDCPTLPVEFCGSYCYEDVGQPVDITDRRFVIVDDQGQEVYQGDITHYDEEYISTEKLTRGEFCFEITEDIYSIIGDGSYDVYVDFYFSHRPKHRSLSAHRNTVDDYANDLYLSESCQDESTATHSSVCIGGTDFDNVLVYIEGGFPLPTGATLCDGLPMEFEHGLLDLSYYVLPNGLIEYYGTAIITDHQGLLDEWGESSWNIRFCDENGDTLCYSAFELDFPEASITCCIDISVNWDKIYPFWSYTNWQTAKGDYRNYLNIRLPFGEVTDPTCILNHYDIDITYIYGSNSKFIGSFDLDGGPDEIGLFSELMSLSATEYNAGGYFEVVITSNCGQSHTYQINLDGTLNLQSGSNNLSRGSSIVNVFPNPAKDILHVSLNSRDLEIKRMTIVDHMGNVKGTYRAEKKTTIPVNNLSSGMYKLVIQLKNAKSPVYKHFIIE